MLAQVLLNACEAILNSVLESDSEQAPIFAFLNVGRLKYGIVQLLADQF